jgi:hypothetical protein
MLSEYQIVSRLGLLSAGLTGLHTRWRRYSGCLLDSLGEVRALKILVAALDLRDELLMIVCGFVTVAQPQL